jgi:hypothetical protein
LDVLDAIDYAGFCSFQTHDQRVNDIWRWSCEIASTLCSLESLRARFSSLQQRCFEIDEEIKSGKYSLHVELDVFASTAQRHSVKIGHAFEVVNQSIQSCVEQGGFRKVNALLMSNPEGYLFTKAWQEQQDTWIQGTLTWIENQMLISCTSSAHVQTTSTVGTTDILSGDLQDDEEEDSGRLIPVMLKTNRRVRRHARTRRHVK